MNKQLKKLLRLESSTLAKADLWERRDLQTMICKSPEEFCKEIDEYIYLVGAEVEPDSFVQDRIDLLGVDSEGSAVIIELKRGAHKHHLSQAISYAAMISKWEPGQFVESLLRFNRQYDDKTAQTLVEAHEELTDILGDGDSSAINRHQRILLLAEEFEYEVLVSAEWLSEHYDVDIRCYRMSLSIRHEDTFLSCSRVYPPYEISDIARSRKRNAGAVGETIVTWDEVLKSVSNVSVKKFFVSQLQDNVASRATSKLLMYSRDSKIWFRVYLRSQFATCIQSVRFAGDRDYWTERLSAEADVKSKNSDRELRFKLQTDEDFSAFLNALKDNERLSSPPSPPTTS